MARFSLFCGHKFGLDRAEFNLTACSGPCIGREGKSKLQDNPAPTTVFIKTTRHIFFGGYLARQRYDELPNSYA